MNHLFSPVIVIFLGSMMAASGAEKGEILFEDLRESRRLFITALSAQIVPEDADVVYARSGGVLRLFCETGSNVKKDEVWAVLNLEKLEMERQSLQVEARTLPETIAKMELVQEELVAKATLGLNEAQTELAEFEALTGVEEFQGDAERSRLVGIARKELLAKVKRSEKRLALDARGVGHETEVERLQLSYKKQKAALRDLEYESEYQAPFDGVLELTSALVPVGGEAETVPREVRIAAGETVAVIKNEEAYRVLVKPLNIDFEGVSRSRLVMIIDSEKDEGAIQAKFFGVRSDPRNPGQVESWVFRVLPQDVGDVKAREAGSQALGSIYAELDEGVSIVAKSVLLERMSEDSQQIGSWKRVVARLLPDCEFVAEGRGALAVKKREKVQE